MKNLLAPVDANGNPLDYTFMNIEIEYSGDNPIYIGYSYPGTGDVDAPVWTIMKLDYSGNNVVRKRFADGSAMFNKVWSQRASYNYTL